mmetsp:Transcript_24726/g.76477  ORF Transcript_24726/g.76477 Transcript_24726/m.76477 type:complete len:212 (-) Transcript_24726:295-930(-)
MSGSAARYVAVYRCSTKTSDSTTDGGMVTGIWLSSSARMRASIVRAKLSSALSNAKKASPCTSALARWSVSSSPCTCSAPSARTAWAQSAAGMHGRSLASSSAKKWPAMRRRYHSASHTCTGGSGGVSSSEARPPMLAGMHALRWSTTGDMASDRNAAVASGRSRPSRPTDWRCDATYSAECSAAPPSASRAVRAPPLPEPRSCSVTLAVT